MQSVLKRGLTFMGKTGTDLFSNLNSCPLLESPLSVILRQEQEILFMIHIEHALALLSDQT